MAVAGANLAAEVSVATNADLEISSEPGARVCARRRHSSPLPGANQGGADVATLVQHQARGTIGATGRTPRLRARIDLEVRVGSDAELGGQVRAGHRQLGLVAPDPGAAERVGALGM